MNETRESGRRLVRLLRGLFATFVIVFIVLGAVIVAGQLVFLLIGQGGAAVTVADVLGPYAFGASTVAGLFAFALTYARGGRGHSEAE